MFVLNTKTFSVDESCTISFLYRADTFLVFDWPSTKNAVLYQERQDFLFINRLCLACLFTYCLLFLAFKGEWACVTQREIFLEVNHLRLLYEIDLSVNRRKESFSYLYCEVGLRLAALTFPYAELYVFVLQLANGLNFLIVRDSFSAVLLLVFVPFLV